MACRRRQSARRAMERSPPSWAMTASKSASRSSWVSAARDEAFKAAEAVEFVFVADLCSVERRPEEV